MGDKSNSTQDEDDENFEVTVTIKKLWKRFLTRTPLWKGLEIKVRGVSKNSGNSLSNRHQNFSISPNSPNRKLVPKMATLPQKS